MEALAFKIAHNVLQVKAVVKHAVLITKLVRNLGITKKGRLRKAAANVSRIPKSADPSVKNR